MATFRNRNGKWQARVVRKGQVPVAKSFQSKQDAERWARLIEADMDKGAYTNLVLAERTTFQELLERYVVGVITLSRSEKIDSIRLRALWRDRQEWRATDSPAINSTNDDPKRDTERFEWICILNQWASGICSF